MVAERLFAQRGLYAVPLRDIGAAAGQKNTVVVQYYFGDREGLILAVASHRVSFLQSLRAELMADVLAGARQLTLVDHVDAYVRSLAANIYPEDNHYLPFLSRFLAERGGYAGLEVIVPDDSVAILRTLLHRLLPDLPGQVIQDRWELVMASAVHALAQYQHRYRSGVLGDDLDALVEDLVQVLAAGLDAPLSAR